MKRYIKSHAMGTIGKYSGKALETKEKLTNGLNSWSPNQFYVNEEFGQIFYLVHKDIFMFFKKKAVV